MREALTKPIYFSQFWTVYGIWAALWFCLECYWLRAYGAVWPAVLMPISITWSVATVFRLLMDRWNATRFWRPYVVKWLSWWIANAIGSSALIWLTLCLLANIWSYLSPYAIVPMMLVPPTIRLIIHAGRDIRAVRWHRDARRGGLIVPRPA